MKLFTLTVILATFFLLGCATNDKSLKEAGPRVHNLAPDFINFWNKVKSQPAKLQVAKFKADFMPKFPEFYAWKIKKWKEQNKEPDQEIKRELAAFKKIERGFVKKTSQITNDLDATVKSFVDSVPDLDRDFDVYITHSFGDMDGGTRTIDDKQYFIFGIDGMVKYHGKMTTETPFFHHELFHVYHGQKFTGNQQDEWLWLALWFEGLATYASKKLNPQATYTDMLLDLPEGMVKRINNDFAFHWQDLSSKLESKDEKDYRHYFLMNSKHKRIVTRAGYYLGFLVVQEIGKTKTLSEMANMEYEEILPAIKKAMESIKPAK